MKFSVSSLIELSQCGERYRQHHIQGIRTPPNSSLLLGRAVDAVVTLDLQTKIKTGELLKVGDVTAVAHDAIEDILLTEGLALSEDEVALGMNRVRAKITSEAVQMAHLHHCYVAPRLEPTQLQRPFEIEIAGHTVTGRFDIQEGSRSVRDTKVTGRAPSLDDADRSLQLTIYAMACVQLDGRIPDHLYLDYLIHAAQPRVVKLETTRGRHQFYAVEERVREAARAVEAGIFIPTTPDSWICSPKYCPYFMGCKYV